MQNYILYQAYGSIDHINECRYSLLKYLAVYNLKPPADTAVVIYTDQPALFESYASFFTGFEMINVDKAQIQQWRGAIDFVHRVKIEVIKDFFTRYSGNLIYLDTDTYITEPLQPLFDGLETGAFYLHEYEGVIDKTMHASFHKWDDFLRTNTLHYNDKQVDLSGGVKVWNAGVIGLNSNNKQLLDDVLALTDVVYQQFPKHIAEQFAFSYCLQKAGTVKTADTSVVHYWNLKEFRKVLNLFFKRNEEESIPNLVKLCHHINAAEIQQQKNQYEQLPLYKKWLNLLTGRGWSIAQYTKKI